MYLRNYDFIFILPICSVYKIFVAFYTKFIDKCKQTDTYLWYLINLIILWNKLRYLQLFQNIYVRYKLLVLLFSIFMQTNKTFMNDRLVFYNLRTSVNWEKTCFNEIWTDKISELSKISNSTLNFIKENNEIQINDHDGIAWEKAHTILRFKRSHIFLFIAHPDIYF